MAKETKNLKLHQVTRPEDDSKAFNLETMLNENWEKLDSAVGDLSQPVTTAEGAAIGLRVQNGRLQYKNNESWTELGLEYEDVQNLVATPAGVITWALPQSTDNTRTAIVLCRASKDITNLDYVECMADSSIFKEILDYKITSNMCKDVHNNTKYWIKVFIKYVIGGKLFHSRGVGTTFTVNLLASNIEFYNTGNEHNIMTGGWEEGFTLGSGGSTSVEKLVDRFKIIVEQPLSPGIARTLVTNIPIDLTLIDKIYVKWKASNLYSCNLYITKSKNAAVSESIKSTSDKGTFTMKDAFFDTSEVNGMHYIAVQAIGFNNMRTEGILEILKIWGV